ncbi:pyridoxamine 5'-phosphate oxidase family protein [Amycolatopsis magusensis]|uniref:Nitroimidazol reductase NimA-like FMN-containing flavoprotein (Pyridoxamine 5'-phosphate oxidase superfamily) n=1 Tax=Amycolatopsis magusensis TaxID=882444 RepID=A0ABS4Q4P0_9PSEU|nr:pyridoxamine 5'-phosphate oxidase family protein [Amycolatopsis magusensis]MBP2186649.1 nitroimidazol reductase NimA-like FMN-containing flavoprotein (pyridoxamine 5'-phosphate oxidase superfamily) [Amycolatopsis magusensis]
MTPLSPTPRSTLTRKKDRGRTERAELHAVLNEGLVCHLGLVLDGSPVVLPTGYGRDGDTLYLHGSTGSPSMRAAATGLDVCVTVTLLDAVVYARSVNDHSMNYRSAVVHGRARLLSGDEKLRGLHALTDHLAPGSWEHAREVNAKEMAAVTVLALDLAEASVKVRDVGALDQPADVAADAAWAGVLPIRTSFGAPETDAECSVPVPAHVAERRVGPSTKPGR